MNREQFDGSMKRVLSFTQSPKSPADVEHLQRYMNSLYEAIGSMDAFLFEKVTVEICKNMGRGQRPMPGQFWAVYSRLKAEDTASKPIEVCPSCKNTIWNMVWMMETSTGAEAMFVEPCHSCQHRHPLKDAPPRAGWVRVEKNRSAHDQEMLDKASNMGRRGARFVLDLVERFRVNFSEEVILKLVERAADTPSEPPTGPAVQALEALTVVSKSEEYEIEE